MSSEQWTEQGRWMRAVFGAILLVLLMGFGELAFRAAGFFPALPLDRAKPGIHAYFWIADKHLGFRNRAHGRYVYDLMAARPMVTTDRHGFRNGTGWDPDTTRPIVLFVGDSIVFCAEVEDNQTIASETAKSLARLENPPGVSILNAGVRGFSTVQSKRMMAECLERYTNIVAVVYAYCGNDFHENIVADSYAPAKAPVARVDAQDGGLREIEVTEPAVPWGQSFIALANDRIRARQVKMREKRWDRRVRDRLREHSAFFHALSSAGSELRSTLPGQGVVPDQAEAAVSHLPPDVDSESAKQVLIALLREMHRLCTRRGIVFLTTACPATRDVGGIDVWCREADVPFVDVSAAFSDAPNSYKARTRDRQYDSHYGSKGTRTFGAAFAPKLAERLGSGP